MRGLRLAAAILCCSALAAPVRAADAPAAPDALDRLFAWWDRLGFPNLASPPCVRVRRPFGPPWGGVGAGGEYGFLFEDDGRRFAVLLADLEVVRLERNPSSDEGAVALDAPRDPLGVAGLVLGEGRASDEARYFLRRAWPWRALALARACAARGGRVAAAALLPQVALPGEAGLAAARDLVEATRAWRAGLIFRAFGDRQRSYESILEEVQSLVRAGTLDAPGAWSVPAESPFAWLPRLIAERDAFRARPPRAAASPEQEAEDLVFALREDTAHKDLRGPWWTREPAAPTSAQERLYALAWDAVPALLAALDDPRPTRVLESSGPTFTHYGGPPTFRVSTVGELAGVVLDALSDGKAREGEARRPAKARAERWWAGVKARGEPAFLAAVARQGGGLAVGPALRLARTDPTTAVECVVAALAVHAPHEGEWALVRALAQVPGEHTTQALLALVARGESEEHGLCAGLALVDRGDGRGVAALARAWRARAQRPGGPSPSTPRAWGPEPGDAVRREALCVLARAPDPDAVRALGEGLDRRWPCERAEVVAALHPTPSAFSFSAAHAREGPPALALPDLPRVPPAAAPADAAVEAVLAARLRDEAEAGALALPGGAKVAVEVGDLAAHALAARFPARWSFDAAGTPKARREAREDLDLRWRARPR